LTRLRRLTATLSVSLFVLGFVSFVLCPRQRVASARGLLCVVISRRVVLCCALYLLRFACEVKDMVNDKDMVVLRHVLSCWLPRGRRTHEIKEQSSKGVDLMGRRGERLASAFLSLMGSLVSVFYPRQCVVSAPRALCVECIARAPPRDYAGKKYLSLCDELFLVGVSFKAVHGVGSWALCVGGVARAPPTPPS
jgi:hypothetical protein